MLPATASVWVAVGYEWLASAKTLLRRRPSSKRQIFLRSAGARLRSGDLPEPSPPSPGRPPRTRQWPVRAELSMVSPELAFLGPDPVPIDGMELGGQPIGVRLPDL